MSDKKNKKVVIVIIVLFLAFGLGLVFLDRYLLRDEGSLNEPAKPNNPSIPSNPANPGAASDNDVNFQILEDASEFFTVANNVRTYLDYVYEQNNEAVYNILAKEYLSANNLNVNNALVEDIPFENMINYTGLNVYYYDLSDSLTVYYIEGEIKEDNFLTHNNTIKRAYVYHKVVMDLDNFTYNVTPINSVESFNTLREETTVNEIETRILKNRFNTFKFQNISTDTIVSTYYYNFLNKMMYEPEEAYKLLNEEYRIKKFATYQSFQEYLYHNLEEMGSATIISYRTQQTNYNIYYIYNSAGKLIIFKEKSLMNYEVYLDEQTVRI